MKKRLLAVGDSFTYGDELENIYHAWPYKLADQLDYTVVNLGKSGCGNSSILRRTMLEISNNSEPYDLIVIGWTSPGRIEWKDHSSEETYDMWPGFQVKGQFFDLHPWRENLLTYINQYHDVSYLYEQQVIKIISLQSFCKLKNIPYVMLDVSGKDYYKKSSPPDGPLIDQIDQNCYIGWGWDGIGMQEIAKGCSVGPNKHPLKEGHQKIANYIYNFINEKNIISNR